jgi:hypothetical protein
MTRGHGDPDTVRPRVMIGVAERQGNPQPENRGEHRDREQSS